MRKRLVIGNALAIVVAGLFAYALGSLGCGAGTAYFLGGVLLLGLASFQAIRVLNELLGRVSQIEEAVLRVSHGEPEVRLGDFEPPFDGLAYRLDRLFETVDAANGVAPSEDAGSRDDG